MSRHVTVETNPEPAAKAAGATATDSGWSKDYENGGAEDNNELYAFYTEKGGFLTKKNLSQ